MFIDSYLFFYSVILLYIYYHTSLCIRSFRTVSDLVYDERFRCISLFVMFVFFSANFQFDLAFSIFSPFVFHFLLFLLVHLFYFHVCFIYIFLFCFIYWTPLLFLPVLSLLNHRYHSCSMFYFKVKK